MNELQIVISSPSSLPLVIAFIVLVLTAGVTHLLSRTDPAWVRAS